MLRKIENFRLHVLGGGGGLCAETGGSDPVCRWILWNRGKKIPGTGLDPKHGFPHTCFHLLPRTWKRKTHAGKIICLS